MPTHPKFGRYEISEDTFTSSYSDPESGGLVSVEKTMTTYEFLDIGNPDQLEPAIYATNAKATPANIDAMANFVIAAEMHTATALAGLTGPHWETAKELISDLVLSNPDMDILGEMFPGANISAPDEVTPDLFREHVSAGNIMGSKSETQPFQITLDIVFTHGAFDQLFACRFSPDGKLTGVETES